MKLQSSKLVIALLGAAALQLAAVSYADDRSGVSSAGSSIKSRGQDAAHADLVRDWNYKGQDNPRDLRLRSDDDLNADLNRDWDGPDQKAADQRRTPHTRSAKQANDDLMRNWGG